MNSLHCSNRNIKACQQFKNKIFYNKVLKYVFDFYFTFIVSFFLCLIAIFSFILFLYTHEHYKYIVQLILDQQHPKSIPTFHFNLVTEPHPTRCTITTSSNHYLFQRPPASQIKAMQVAYKTRVCRLHHLQFLDSGVLLGITAHVNCSHHNEWGLTHKC